MEGGGRWSEGEMDRGRKRWREGEVREREVEGG